MRALMIAMLAAGCGGSDAPSCNTATDRFYIAGCRYLDEHTMQPLGEQAAIALCEDWSRRASAGGCGSELDALLECEAVVPIGSTGAACCNATYTALINCLPL